MTQALFPGGGGSVIVALPFCGKQNNAPTKDVHDLEPANVTLYGKTDIETVIKLIIFQ